MHPRQCLVSDHVKSLLLLSEKREKKKKKGNKYHCIMLICAIMI